MTTGCCETVRKLLPEQFILLGSEILQHSVKEASDKAWQLRQELDTHANFLLVTAFTMHWVCNTSLMPLWLLLLLIGVCVEAVNMPQNLAVLQLNPRAVSNVTVPQI